ncbi:MAG: hypothetical protein AUG80_03225 [Candidatus Rokubacteria bacterium 13_1_20CM_4_68_9]|nr:MAG: hypothetical protein AUG80_03225 [Candidatus Rokubacteria bacterium 13_1_20CM_4_68_9]
MFGIPGEVFWPTASVGAIILLVFAGVAVLRLLPRPKSSLGEHTERGQALEDFQGRLAELDQLTHRVNELEERLDFAERLLAKQREDQRLGSGQD